MKAQTMKAHWIICNLGKDDHVQQLYYGVLEAGRTAEVISFKDFAEMISVPFQGLEPVVTSGSIWMMNMVRKNRPNWTGCWHDSSLYTCSRYYSHWGKYITQQNHIMLTFAELVRRYDWVYDTLANQGRDSKKEDDEIFIRPDSGEKEFTGELVSRARFNAWVEYTQTLEHYRPDLLVVACEPVRIDREFRFVIKDRKVVTGSLYRMGKHNISARIGETLDCEDRETTETLELRAREFAEDVLQEGPPMPAVHTIDIAVDWAGAVHILELGCFCCAGLYMCDRRAVALAVSEAAEQEYDRRFPA